MNAHLKYTLAFVLSGLLSTQCNAQLGVNKSNNSPTNWSITTSLGMGYVDSMEGLHGQTALGRVAFNYALTPYLGLESGIQNGALVRFSVPKTTLELLGGVPIGGTIRPLVDVLVTAKTPLFSPATPVYAHIKAGIAYRQLQMDRETINDVTYYTPEIQLGLGYKVSSRLDVHLTFQHLAGKNPDIQADALTETARIAHIPAQRAVLLGLNLTLE